MSSITPLVEPPNTSVWGKTFIADVNTRLVEINGYIDDGLEKMEKSLKACLKTGLDAMKTTLKDNISTAVVNAMAGYAERLTETEIMSTQNQQHIQSLQKKIDVMSVSYGELKSKMRFYESRNRCNNIIFHGVDESETESDVQRVQKLKSVIKEKLKFSENTLETIKINKCTRTKGPKTNNCRPICVTFGTSEMRKQVWGERNKLKNVHNMYMTEDYAPDVQRERRKLYQILNHAKTLPGYQDNTFVNFDNLLCYGKSYRCDTLHLLPQPLQPRKASERSNDEMVVFGGPNSEEHPLCNWKRLDTPLEYGGKSFPTAEHAYLYQKAKFMKDQSVCDNILSSESPADAKRFSHKLRYNREWDNHKYATMKQILKRKFQDASLATELSETGIKEIHEAGRSSYWATGTSLNHKHVLQKDKWSGESMLGKLLMDIRAEL